MKYETWPQLIERVKGLTGVEYKEGTTHPLHKGLSINGKLPYSISEYEFNFIRDHIIARGLKSGYELGTGIAVSTIAIGEAMRMTGGRLLTVDSYAEEVLQFQPMGAVSRGKFSQAAIDRNYKIINFLGLKETVRLERGWSPEDCIDLLGDKKLDFVFLDCPKDAEDFERDIKYIAPRMGERYTIFVHDTHGYFSEFAVLSKKYLGVKPEFINHYKNENGDEVIVEFPLAKIEV